MVLCCEGADVHSSPVLNPRQAAASEDERTSSRQGRVSFQTSSEKARAESEAGECHCHSSHRRTWTRRICVVARSSLLMWPLLLVIAGTTLPLASDDEVKKSLLPSRYADAVTQILFYLFSFLPIPRNFFLL